MVNIRKKEQFSAFIEYLEEGAACHWIQIAKALNIDKDTITEWRKDERAQETIKKGINRALVQMEKVGRRDWRMYEAKLKMLGITQIDRTDITSGDLPIPILDITRKDINISSEVDKQSS